MDHQPKPDDPEALERELRLLLKAKSSIQRHKADAAFNNFVLNVDHMTHDQLVEAYNMIVTRLAGGQ